MEINTKKSLKLEWTKVAFFIEPIIKSIIGRVVKCSAGPCDRSYWSIEAVNDTFTVSEINKLLSLVDSDDEMCEESIQNDSDNSRSLGMKLSEALLKVALSTHWKESCITETSLWLIDFDDYWVKVPEISTEKLSDYLAKLDEILNASDGISESESNTKKQFEAYLSNRNR